MPRTYYTSGDLTWAEGSPLDAHTARVLMQGNAEAIYEEARYDYCEVLPTSEQASAGWYHGPVPVVLRRDRDGLWRTLRVTLLAAGGSDGHNLRIWLTEGWWQPQATRDLYDDCPVPASATCDWQTPKDLTPPRGWRPSVSRLESADDEQAEVAVGWLFFEWVTSGGVSPPLFAGYRLEEVIDV